tara:strand:- start:582 stop:1232 length:651 start_codon:yes stop_codon:yes gene_type:complete
MKRLVTILLSFLFVSLQSVKAEMGIGITGAAHMFDVSGTETTRSSGEKNPGSHSETAVVPELFIEAILDNGGAVGIAYIPTREMGSKSRSDTNSDGDTGTYKAEAELDNVVQLYADIPLTDIAGYSVYGKVGIQHATINSLESLNSGSTYPNKDVLGYTLGLGTKGDLPVSNLYYKADVTYTDFQDYSADSDSTVANHVTAELEDVAFKLSIGYKF